MCTCDSTAGHTFLVCNLDHHFLSDLAAGRRDFYIVGLFCLYSRSLLDRNMSKCDRACVYWLAPGAQAGSLWSHTGGMYQTWKRLTRMHSLRFYSHGRLSWGFWGSLLVESHFTNVPRWAGLRLRETAPHRVTGFAAVVFFFQKICARLRLIVWLWCERESVVYWYSI